MHFHKHLNMCSSFNIKVIWNYVYNLHNNLYSCRESTCMTLSQIRGRHATWWLQPSRLWFPFQMGEQTKLWRYTHLSSYVDVTLQSVMLQNLGIGQVWIIQVFRMLGCTSDTFLVKWGLPEIRGAQDPVGSKN
jgi:hypothetical protein